MASIIEYRIRSKDESKPAVDSAEQGIKRLHKGVEAFGKVLTGAFLGGATVQVIRQLVQFGASSIQAAKDAGLLTPELDKITKQVNGLKLAIGTGLAAGLKGVFAGAAEGMSQLSGNRVATVTAGVIEKIGQSFKLLWDLVWTTGSAALIRPFVFMGQVGLEVLKAMYVSFLATVTQIGLIWDNMAYGVKSVWANVIGWIVDALNKVLALYNNSLLAKITGGLGQIGKPASDLGAKPGAVNSEAITKPFADAFGNIKTMTVAFGQSWVDSFTGLYDDVINLFGGIEDVAIPVGKDVGKAIAKASAYGMEEFFASYQPSGPSGGAYAEAGGGGATEMMGAPGIGALGSVASAFAGLGQAGDMLSGVFNAIANGGDPIAILLAVLQPLIQAFAVTIMPTLNAILKPFIGYLATYGAMLGKIILPILEMLAPVLNVVAEGLLLLYNWAIVPLANAIIFVFNLIYDVVVTVWNAIAWSVNAALGWLGVHLDYMDYRAMDQGFLSQISMDEMASAGDTSAADAAAANTASGAGASYSGAPTYNIFITNNFEAGSVIDSSGTWTAFVRKVWNDGTLLETARQGA